MNGIEKVPYAGPERRTDSPSSSLLIGGSRDVYNIAEVEKTLGELSASAHEGQRTLYEKMLRRGSSRSLVRPSNTDCLRPLYESCPNFSSVLDELTRSLALSVLGCEPFQFTPLLLLGEPGIGKTHFARELSKVLYTELQFVSMNSLTAGWVLTGSSAQWKNSGPGRVAKAFVHGEYANPLFLIDEIDKVPSEAQYDPMAGLYTLLEESTARTFIDEFLEIPINTEYASWVATANKINTIPGPILSRMSVHIVPTPTKNQSRGIGYNLYKEMIGKHDWGFQSEPSEAVLEKLAAKPPRDMKQILRAAFGTATLDRRDHLIPKDLDVDARISKPPMGFCPEA